MQKNINKYIPLFERLLSLLIVFLLLAGIFLYTAAAEKGCYFAFFFRERNFRLIFSKHFGCYLLISLILSVCSLVLFLLWSRLMDAIPLIT